MIKSLKSLMVDCYTKRARHLMTGRMMMGAAGGVFHTWKPQAVQLPLMVITKSIHLIPLVLLHQQ